MEKRDNPHGAAEGYCLSRTRGRISRAFVGLLWLAAAAWGFYVFHARLQEDRAGWDFFNYANMAFFGVGGLIFLFRGGHMSFTGARDAFFPDKSALADSIRGQLPDPDGAPPVGDLFAMVDGDLRDNGQWFGSVGIGREWVLGDLANRIDRLRGIFTVDRVERIRHHKKRILQLVLVDDRWQKHVTDFKDHRDLRAAANCLALRVPDARRGDSAELDSFWTTSESKRERLERDFRQRQAFRASEAVRRESASGGPQDMILTYRNGEMTSQVSASLVEEALERCLGGEEAGFRLTPNCPVEAQGWTLHALDCTPRAEGGVLLLLELTPGEEALALARTLGRREALEILTAWLRREAPDLVGWDLRRLYQSPGDSRGARAGNDKTT